MNRNFSLWSADERPGLPDAFLVRSFQADDRAQILRLHGAAAPSGSVDCDCASKIDQIEEKYFRRPQDHFWVAEAGGRIVGTVGVCVQDGNVAHLHCLRAIDDSTDHVIRRALVQVAAGHAHEHGCLKLVVHPPNVPVDIERAAEFLHRLGFEFSRHREVENQPVFEFYLNLYERPELGPYDRAASPGTAKYLA
ncbi:MAG TPA: GNAT family N-acetyltransferase [Tepidisphaeraceae bacterium]|jgi:N-acetylglutamate synthase-like GNAT family acetyltransferase|nr:GNAT family N-acetyltransferase [Tepidisphaeraceae bacterium]